MAIRHIGATKLSHGVSRRAHNTSDAANLGPGMSIAQSLIMTRQWKGAALVISFVAAVVLSIAVHSVIAAVIVLLSAISVSYVIGIAWMRTSTHRERDKPHSLP